MSHFPPQDWVDRARGVGSAEQQRKMQRHLEDGCEICCRDGEIWRIVVDCLSREPSLEAPEAATRVVKAAFASEKTARRFAPAQIAHLLFDSWLQPGAVAARAAIQDTRQLMYQAEPFVIDLRMESDPSRQLVLLMGQVLNSNAPERVSEPVEVVLLRDEEVIAKSSANAAGEFDIACPAGHELRLLVSIRDQRAVALVLPPFEG
jgi:hypothetical protein